MLLGSSAAKGQEAQGENVNIYHFVNKYPKSYEVSRSQRDQHSAIRRHVRLVIDQQRRRKAKAAALPLSESTERILRSNKVLNNTELDYTTEQSWIEEKSLESKTDDGKPLVHRIVAPLFCDTAAVESSITASNPNCEDDKGREWLSAMCLSPTGDSLFDACSGLPFNLTSKDIQVIEYWLGQSSYLCIDTNVSPTQSHLEQVEKPMRVHHIQSSVSNEMRLASLMVSLVGSWDRHRRVSWSEMYGEWMNRALTAIRDNLGADVVPTSEILVAIVCLVGAEDHRRNAASVRIHLQAAAQLMTAANGRATIDSFFQSYLIHTYDTRLACEESSLPILLPPNEVQGATVQMRETFRKAFAEMESLGQGFRALHPQLLPHSVLSIVNDMVDCFTVHLGYLQQSSCDTDISKWILMQRVALRYKLLHLQSDVPLRQAVRTALLMWSFNCQTSPSVGFTMSALATNLLALLSQNQEWMGDTATRDLTTWMMITGAISTESSDELDWFSQEISKLLPGHTDAEECLKEMAGDMARFLYLDGVRAVRMRKLAHIVVVSGPANVSPRWFGDFG